MDEITKTYLKILFETTLSSLSELNPKDFIKSNGNFPENENINITSYLNLPECIEVILPKHCIKSISEQDIHGFNYLELTKSQCINCISNALNELLVEFPTSRLLKMSYCDFAVICIQKSSETHYRLSFRVKSNRNKKNITVFLKSIFKSDKKTSGTGNKHRIF